MSKQTRPAPAKKRGRPPRMASGAMSDAERKLAERERKKQQGYKLMWISKEEQEVIRKMRDESA